MKGICNEFAAMGARIEDLQNDLNAITEPESGRWLSQIKRRRASVEPRKSFKTPMGPSPLRCLR